MLHACEHGGAHRAERREHVTTTLSVQDWRRTRPAAPSADANAEIVVRAAAATSPQIATLTAQATTQSATRPSNRIRTPRAPTIDSFSDTADMRAGVLAGIFLLQALRDRPSRRNTPAAPRSRHVRLQRPITPGSIRRRCV
jgi:hypothetical protein